MLARPAD